MMSFMDDMLAPTSPRPHLLSHQTRRTRRPSHSNTNDAVSGIVRRSRSIQIDPDAVPGKQFAFVWTLVCPLLLVLLYVYIFLVLLLCTYFIMLFVSSFWCFFVFGR